MNENRKDIYKRTKLVEVIPLSTPYKINIDVANACNFKCNFCFHAMDNKELKKSGFKPNIMNYELFKIIIKQIKDFPEQIKCIGLTGVGEPLLNKRLPDMIQLTKGCNVADKVVVTTNGSLLNHQLSKSLIDAGLDEIIISIEALNDKTYYGITLTKISFDRLVGNIEYLYKNRGKCKVFVKILDIAFNESNDEKKFHEIFNSISDMAYVEKVIPQFKQVNYAALNLNYEQTLYGKELLSVDVCSMIFYAMQISTSGNVCPCCVDYNETVVFGNVKINDLFDIWNNAHFNGFRRNHLKKKRNSIKLCHDCDYLIYNVRDEDILDRSSHIILDKI